MISRLIARFPTLSAAVVYALAVLLAFNRFFAGQVLLPPGSDQKDGYPPRLFAAEYFKEFGSIPEWSPYLFGGFPFVSNTGFGDTFFPTFLLRLILPVDQGMALGLMLFIFLAGLFAFLFFRSLGLSWGAAFVGGAGYMFSGMVVSLVSPGHDGKIFVSSLLPLALLFIRRAAVQGDWRQYLYFGVVVGFSLLSPSFQTSYYMLMAAGFFWFFMIFLSGERAASERWWRASLLFAGALLIGFAMAAIQLLPFLEYLPFSPRGGGVDWIYATSWSMPPEEALGSILPGFNGVGIDNYYGRNNFKFHSDYLGMVVALLALLSFKLEGRRRLAWFFIFLIGYAALFAFGGHTPFYKIPYSLLPGIASTRAPSIIYFLVAFGLVSLAALGTEYLLGRVPSNERSAKKSARRESGLPGSIDRTMLIGVSALAAVVLLASVQGLRPLADAIANMQSDYNPDVAERAVYAGENYPRFVRHAWIALILAVGAVAILIPANVRRIGSHAAALMVGVVVLLDLWMIEKLYIRFSPRAEEIMPVDDVVATLRADTTVFRVMPLRLSISGSPYTANYLMAHRIRTALGYNGFELHAYDELLGGKNSWTTPPFVPEFRSTILFDKLWQLLGVRYVIAAPRQELPPALARFAPVIDELTDSLETRLILVGDSLRAYDGSWARIYRLRDPLPFALLVPIAWKVNAPIENVIATVLSPRFDARGLLIVPDSAGVGQDSVSAIGTPLTNAVHVREPRPGRFEFRLDRPAEADAFLYVAENYFPAWKARVDGVEARVVPAQVSLMAVPIPAGARSVEMEFSSPAYHRGRIITPLTLLTVLAIAGAGWYRKRRETPGDGGNAERAAARRKEGRKDLA